MARDAECGSSGTHLNAWGPLPLPVRQLAHRSQQHLPNATLPLHGRVAEACVTTLQEMNPFVRVSALPGPLPAVLQPEALQRHDLLLLCGQPAGVVAAADAACRQAKVPFYAGACRGIYGWAFADLQEHRFVVEVGGCWAGTAPVTDAWRALAIATARQVSALRPPAGPRTGALGHRGRRIRCKPGVLQPTTTCGRRSRLLPGHAPDVGVHAAAAPAEEGGAGRRQHPQDGGGAHRALCQLGRGAGVQPAGCQPEAA